MTFRLRELVRVLDDDDDWCPTPPHWPPRPPRWGSLEELASRPMAGFRVADAELNPQPIPPGAARLVAALGQQVRLYQIGRGLEAVRGAPGELGAEMARVASSAFDDTCGTVPLTVLIQLLLRHPPPPPPWLREMEAVAVQVALAARMEGASGAPMQEAGMAMLRERLAGLTDRQRGAMPG